jgi:cystathionine gamma-synthase
MHLETRAVHAGRSADPSTGAVVPPIHLATTFERAAPESRFPERQPETQPVPSIPRYRGKPFFTARTSIVSFFGY